MCPKLELSPIQRHYIRDFKSIANQKIELGQINVFIGAICRQFKGGEWIFTEDGCLPLTF